jgi:hypothetical protein
MIELLLLNLRGETIEFVRDPAHAVVDYHHDVQLLVEFLDDIRWRPLPGEDVEHWHQLLRGTYDRVSSAVLTDVEIAEFRLCLEAASPHLNGPHNTPSSSYDLRRAVMIQVNTGAHELVSTPRPRPTIRYRVDVAGNMYDIEQDISHSFDAYILVVAEFLRLLDSYSWTDLAEAETYQPYPRRIVQLADEQIAEFLRQLRNVRSALYRRSDTAQESVLDLDRGLRANCTPMYEIGQTEPTHWIESPQPSAIASTPLNEPNPLRMSWPQSAQSTMEVYRVCAMHTDVTFIADPSYPAEAYTSAVAELVTFMRRHTDWRPLLGTALLTGIRSDRQWYAVFEDGPAAELVARVLEEIPYDDDNPMNCPVRLSRGLLSAHAAVPAEDVRQQFQTPLLTSETLRASIERSSSALSSWPSAGTPLFTVQPSSQRPRIEELSARSRRIDEYIIHVRTPEAGEQHLDTVLLDPSIPESDYIPAVAELRSWLWTNSWSFIRSSSENGVERRVYRTVLSSEDEYGRLHRAAELAVFGPAVVALPPLNLSDGLRTRRPVGSDTPQYFRGASLISGETLRDHLRQVGRAAEERRHNWEDAPVVTDVNGYRFVLDLPHSDIRAGRRVYRIIRPGEPLPQDTPVSQAETARPKADIVVSWYDIDVFGAPKPEVLAFGRHIASFDRGEVSTMVRNIHNLKLADSHTWLVGLLAGYKALRVLLQVEPITPAVRKNLYLMWPTLQPLLYSEKLNDIENIDRAGYRDTFRCMWSTRGKIVELVTKSTGIHSRQPPFENPISSWLGAERHRMDTHYLQNDQCFWTANSFQGVASKLELKEQNTLRPRQILALEDQHSA